MHPIVDIYGGAGGYGGSGSARSGPGYLLQSGGQKDGSCCSADGNDYAYVEDLLYPPASTTTMTATGCGPGPPAASFGHLNHPQTVITAASAAALSRRDGTSPAGAGLRIMHHML